MVQGQYGWHGCTPCSPRASKHIVIYIKKKHGERFVDCHWEEDKQEWGKREELHSLLLHKGGGGGGVVCLGDLELPELINLYSSDPQ